MELLNKQSVLSSILLVVFILIYSCSGDSGNSGNKYKTREISIQLALAQKISKTSFTKGCLYAQKALYLSQKYHNDTLKIKSKILLARIIWFQGDGIRAVNLLNECLMASRKIGFRYGECEAFLEIGIIEYSWGRYNIAFQNFNNAMNLAEKLKLYEIQAISFNYIGKFYHTTGAYNKSIVYYQRAFQIQSKIGNRQSAATVLLSLGKTFLNINNIYKALQCYLDAYKILENSDNYLDFAGVCSHLGSTYLALGQNDKAQEYHRKALLLRSKLNNPEGMAKSFNNLGETFLASSQYDSALYYFRQALKYSNLIRYKKGRLKALTNIGELFLLKKDHAQAIENIRNAYHESAEAGYSTGIAESSLLLGKYFYAVGNIKKALFYLNESLVKSDSFYLEEKKQEIYQYIYNCYRTSGNNSLALKYYILFNNIEKNKLKSETDRQLTELRITFDLERKEKDNQVLRQENELKEMSIQRKTAFIWFSISALAFSLLLCLYIYNRFVNKRKANEQLQHLNNKITIQNQKLEILNNELEKSNREKDKILSIIAHELRNPLYWFQNLAEVLSKKYNTMAPDKIQKSLNSLDESAKNAFHLMDNLLNWSRSRLNRITPHVELHNLKSLVTESGRMFDSIIKQKDINLDINISDNIKINVDPNLFACIIRNLISNAIKFTPENGKISIGCQENEDCYVISCSDSGIGISEKNVRELFKSDFNSSVNGLLNEKGSGFGLKLCREFVEMNKGKIWVEDINGKGAKFIFTVPR